MPPRIHITRVKTRQSSKSKTCPQTIHPMLLQRQTTSALFPESSISISTLPPASSIPILPAPSSSSTQTCHLQIHIQRFRMLCWPRFWCSKHPLFWTRGASTIQPGNLATYHPNSTQRQTLWRLFLEESLLLGRFLCSLPSVVSFIVFASDVSFGLWQFRDLPPLDSSSLISLQESSRIAPRAHWGIYWQRQRMETTNIWGADWWMNMCTLEGWEEQATFGRLDSRLILVPFFQLKDKAWQLASPARPMWWHWSVEKHMCNQLKRCNDFQNKRN